MAVTLKSIAKAANVSITTASLILNQKEGAIRFSADTIRRVREASLSLGYIPNMSARNLRQSESGNTSLTLAVLWPIDARVGLIGRILTGIHRFTSSLETITINLLVKTMDEDGIQGVKELYDSNVFNGAILANVSAEDEAYIHKVPPSVPIVLFSRTSPIYPYVWASYFETSQKVAEHFIRNKHRRIVILASNLSSQALDQKLAGFVETLDAKEYLIRHCSFTEESGYDAVAKLIKAGDVPTGLICVCDQTAMGALSALHDHGISIPGECEVFGFDNQSFSNFTIPKLSTVNLPVEEMASGAMELLVQKILDPNNLVRYKNFELKMIHRGTTKKAI
ncbi:LacI family DNA-binding transcriptional regulator [Pelosinus propionicus]|uniref:DNA-binding transcriptional regulator, LacI/PurR family n=1 Tax=Pelosinus propionicus DSM 13327 TaxID=1123291 RepID=A0A1I4GYK9_9FIRM|nr:LacI family DNA-binding transcriptional regulator [Pelosinus propionicus]SFL34640.1 DNA-binding transcriptional regulator, LacI/PurR family [Pelosinus propionicus DSM 13327]